MMRPYSRLLISHSQGWTKRLRTSNIATPQRTLSTQPISLKHQRRQSSSKPPPLPSGQPRDRYYGLTTFANLLWHPYLSCTSSTLPKYDIAILGAPFDTGTTYRPGARFGPAGIRRGSQRIDPSFAWSAYTRKNPFTAWANVVDVGDIALVPLDNTVALRQLEDAHRLISSRPANALDYSSVPRIITLGGDHTTTLPALRVAKEHWGPVSVVHFDAHTDTWDPKHLGGDISAYARVNHGTFLHFAYEEGLLCEDSSIHVGIRGPMGNAGDDWENDRRCGFTTITARDIDRIGVRGVIEMIKARVGGTNTYVSVDIDVLDPAFAPGTGTPEVGGWSTRELLSVLDGLAGVRVVGADVVEVAPAYDSAGEITIMAAAEVALSLISLMVETPVVQLNDVVETS